MKDLPKISPRLSDRFFGFVKLFQTHLNVIESLSVSIQRSGHVWVCVYVKTYVLVCVDSWIQNTVIQGTIVQGSVVQVTERPAIASLPTLTTSVAELVPASVFDMVAAARDSLHDSLALLAALPALLVG